jgi:L-iditol 2-dehydrogenase
MKAVVKIARGKGLVELKEVPKPSPAPDEVLIRIRAVSICGSDIHIADDEHPYWPPVILGHEFSGEIAEVGKEVKNWKVGDKVISETRTRSCGRCRACQEGFPQICPEKRPPGIGINGAMSEFLVMPARLLHRMPANISFDEAAIIEPTAICIHALVERVGIKSGERVVIIGAGPIGLFSLQLAKLAGSSWVITSGTPRSASLKLKRAKELGADYTVNIGKSSLKESVLELTQGEGADLVVETSGSQTGIKEAFEIVRKRGRICAIGIYGKPTVEIPWDVGIFKAIQLTFCFSSSWTAWETGIRLIEKGALQLAPLITHRFPLSAWQEAFELMKHGQALKVILHP